MVNNSDIYKLYNGVDEWNAWRVQANKAQPDLSGLDIQNDERLITIFYINETKRFLVQNVDFSNTNLRNANLGATTFKHCNFRGADLSKAVVWHCEFENCSLGPAEKAIDDKKRDSGVLTKTDHTEFSSIACKLNRTVLFGTHFVRTSLCYVNLTTVQVDEATKLETVSVINTRISRQVLERMKDYGGLTIGRRRQMEIVDDIMTLRQSFSGFWNKLHFFAMSIFLAPYIWFLAKQWFLANIGEEVTNKLTSPIIINLIRFIVSGGDTWREWQPAFFPISLFLLALIYNAVRGILLVKSITLEHKQIIQGFYPEFALVGKWKAVYKSYKLFGIIAIVVLVLHTFMFLIKRVPL